MKAVLSMLHESAFENSATRAFRGEAVLRWTLKRISASARIENARVLCWDDQREAVEAAGGEAISAGPRVNLPQIEAVSAARRWADGWRGGLLSTTHFDLGFSPQHLLRATEDQSTVLIDPAAGLIDPQLLDSLVDHGATHTDVEYAFLPAAPGFGAIILRRTLLERLAKANAIAGKLFTYQPDAPLRDAIAGEACAPVPVTLARTTRRFNLDSQQQIAVLESAWQNLNGQLIETSAERLLAIAGPAPVVSLPRDVTIELTTRRATNPIFSLTGKVERADLSREHASKLFKELASRDDVRVTLAGVGDPLLHHRLLEIISAARDAGIRAIHIETDLLPASVDSIDHLVRCGVDVVSVHMPALSPALYRDMMGVDRLGEVIENVKRFITTRAQLNSGVPVLAPTFVKARQNLAEMEQWYDQWLRAVGSAVIVAPSTFGGVIEDVSVGNMAPSARVPCRRITDRMTILCDGTIVSCEEDLIGRRAMGNINESAIEDVWQRRFGELRASHADRTWNKCGLCRGCSEWHR